MITANDIISTKEQPPKPAISGLQPNHRKSKLCLELACRKLLGILNPDSVDEDAFSRTAVITLTFVKPTMSWKDAKNELDKIIKLLKRRHGNDLELVWVQERHRSGGIHFHGLVKLPFDVRTGTDLYVLLDWNNQKDNPKFRDRVKNCHSYLNQQLREEVIQLSKVLSQYGIGRFDLLPILTDAEAVIEYLGKGIANHLLRRHPEDKGARLWGCTNNVRVCKTNSISLFTPINTMLRNQIGMWAESRGCMDLNQLRRKYGRHWFFKFLSERDRYGLDEFKEDCGIRKA